jgi:hypothetical protein
MSESQSIITVLAYVIGLIPGMYFAYRLLREVFYYFKHDDEDIL